MKKHTYIFVLLLCFSFTLINAKAEFTILTTQLFEQNKPEKSLKEKFQSPSINTKNFPPSNRFRFEKPTRLRGLVSLTGLVNINFLLLDVFSDKKLIYSFQSFNFLQLFFSNKKRGPPIIIFS